MRGRLINATIVATLGMLLMGTTAAYANQTTPGRSHLKAVVIKVAHVATGGAYVTLSAITTNSAKGAASKVPLRYSWDLTTDGIFETPLSVSPTITRYYAPTASGMVTATVKATDASPTGGAMSKVTFSLLVPRGGQIHMIRAVVVKVAHVATGGAYVTLSVITPGSAKLRASSTPMRFAWDLTTDGIFETPLSVNPTITRYYGPTASGMVTATVKAVGGTAVRGAMSKVTFSLLVPRGGQIHMIQAVVVKVAHVATGGAYVTLSVITPGSAKLRASSTPMRFAWDLTTDGIFETPLSVNPTITRYYGPTASGMVTATVKAVGGTAVRGAMSKVTFSLIP